MIVVEVIECTPEVIMPAVKQIPIYRMTGGSRRYPETLTFEIAAYALVDECDVDLTRYRWFFGSSARKNGSIMRHIIRRERRKTISLHSVIAGRMGFTGCIGHRNGDRLNNTRSNLRPSTELKNTLKSVRISKRAPSQNRTLSQNRARNVRASIKQTPLNPDQDVRWNPQTRQMEVFLRSTGESLQLPQLNYGSPTDEQVFV